MRLRIGIVCPYDFFRHGGVKEHVAAVADELRERGHYVKVIAPNPPDDGENLDPDNVITLGRSTRATATGTTFEVSASAEAGEIDQMLEGENFDILHYHEPMVPLLAGQILAKSKSINIATFHAAKPDDLRNKPMDLIYLPYHRNRSKYLNYVTAVSDAAAAFLSKAMKDDEIAIVPNGIRLSVFDPKKISEYDEFNDGKKNILYVGRLEKRKGVDHLLRAYQKLRDQHDDIRLIIAGDGEKRFALETYIEQYGLEDVHLLGFVSEEDKLRLLKTCDVFASPAMYGESFGIVLLEAMAMGVPVVAGTNPGYESVMVGPGRLSLVSPKHHGDFARRLELFLYEPSIAKPFLEWSKKYVKQFDYSNITDQYLAIYEKLVDEHKEA